VKLALRDGDSPRRRVEGPDAVSGSLGGPTAYQLEQAVCVDYYQRGKGSLQGYEPSS
jgi:hypothetical protein